MALKITPLSTACVTLNRYTDYVPGISCATNLVDLLLNYVAHPYLGKERLQNNHYFAYLETKSWYRSAILVMPAPVFAYLAIKTRIRSITWVTPVIGNILIAISDLYCAVQARRYEKLAQDCNALDTENIQKYYDEAAYYGSIQAQYWVGLQCMKDPQYHAIVRDIFREAAVWGHLAANQALEKKFGKPT